MKRWIRLPEKLSYRLVVLFVALFVATLGTVIGLSLIIANRQLSSSVDNELSGLADTAEERLRQPADQQVVLNELSTQAQFLQLLDKSGAVTKRSSNLRFESLPSFIRNGQPKDDGFHNYTFRKTSLRIIRRANLDNGVVTGYLVIGLVVPSVQESTLDLAIILGSTAAAGLIAVIAGSIWVAHREATPLQRLAEDVLATADSGFTRPIGAPTSGSREARDLHDAFNVLIERQRQVIGRERAFFADSSHVLRTPLAVLQGDIEMLEQGVYGKERQEAVAQARAAIDTMSRTVSGLLLLAREDAPAGSGWEVVDLRALLATLVNDARTAFPGHHFESELAADAEVAGNQNQLRDLFISLIENAGRYTPPGGRVGVSAAAAGGDVIVTVGDSGIGFNEDDAAHATDRFYRGAEARRLFPGGSGLGLAIAQRIVTLHNGSISFAANEPRGACVIVRLPALG